MIEFEVIHKLELNAETLEINIEYKKYWQYITNALGQYKRI